LTSSQSPVSAAPFGFLGSVVRTSDREITVGYCIPQSENVTIQLFDLQGKLLRFVVLTRQVAGYHETSIDVSGISIRCYALRIKAGANDARIGWSLSGWFPRF
jgi:hypothetical protein